MKLALIHFNPIESYPPAINMIRYLSNNSDFKIIVHTTVKENSNWIFSEDNTNITRTKTKKSTAILRYLLYFTFNFKTLALLIASQPSIVICYETLSVLPVYIYKFFFVNKKVLIHFHEYTSAMEIEKASLYMKFLTKIESFLLPQAEWVSHTNGDRLNLFEKDYPRIKFKHLAILPNYPPNAWKKFAGKKNNREDRKSMKFVYVGALSPEATYVKEFSEWVNRQEGTVTWDVFSSNHSKNLLTIPGTFESPWINFKGEVLYDDLPTILSQYDVGVIFYRGIIPNHIYSAPNKLFEYLSVGLNVWISKELLGSKPYITKDNSNRIQIIDYNRLPLEFEPYTISPMVELDENGYCYEEEYEKLLSFIEKLGN